MGCISILPSTPDVKGSLWFSRLFPLAYRAEYTPSALQRRLETAGRRSMCEKQQEEIRCICNEERSSVLLLTSTEHSFKRRFHLLEYPGVGSYEGSELRSSDGSSHGSTDMVAYTHAAWETTRIGSGFYLPRGCTCLCDLQQERSSQQKIRTYSSGSRRKGWQGIVTRMHVGRHFSCSILTISSPI